MCFYFDNYEEDEFVITRDDEILFNEIESLYNNVNETWDRQKKHYLPYIIQNGHIDVHSCDKEYNEANSFELYKVNDDMYKFTYNIKDSEKPEVLISMNGLDSERNIYSPYNRLFLQTYMNLYKHDYNLDEDFSLKLKK